MIEFRYSAVTSMLSFSVNLTFSGPFVDSYGSGGAALCALANSSSRTLCTSLCMFSPPCTPLAYDRTSRILVTSLALSILCSCSNSCF